MKWEWFCGTVQVKEYGIGSLQAGKKDGNSPLVYVSYSSSFRIFHYTREGQNISQYCCLPGKRQRLLFAGVSGPCSLPGPLVARLYLICGVCGPKNWTIKSDFLQAGTTQQVLNEDLPLQSEEKVRDLSVGVPKDVRQPKKKAKWKAHASCSICGTTPVQHQTLTLVRGYQYSGSTIFNRQESNP